VRRLPEKDDRWRVDYSYEVNESRFTRGSSMSRSAGRGFSPGAIVDVRYVPANPARSWIAGHEPEAIPVWVPFLVGGLMCLSGVLLLWSVRRQRSMLERGRAAIARVTTTRRIRSEYKTSSVSVNYE